MPEWVIISNKIIRLMYYEGSQREGVKQQKNSA